MRYVIIAVPEDSTDLEHPLAGTWELAPVERAPVYELADQPDEARR